LNPRDRTLAVASLLATAAFGVLFFAIKHRPRLAAVAPFVEDPYDAVGSFAVQLAAVAAALSALRAVAGAGATPGAPDPMIERSAGVAWLALFVALAADAVAMARHPGAWMGVPVGRALAALVFLCVLVSAAGIAMIARSSDAWERARRTIVVAAAGALALALFPETWRRGVAGAILVAMAGAAILLFETWALALVLWPLGSETDQDLMDLLAGVRAQAKQEGAHVRPEAPAFARWLRARHWRVVAVVAVASGLALAATEAFGEGLPASARRALLVLSVFTAIESAGILLGYALFRRRLGLVRTE
jgi:hypothetical protein